MPPGQPADERGDDLAGGAVAAVPGDLERAPAAAVVCAQARDVIVEDAVLLDPPARPPPAGRAPAAIAPRRWIASPKNGFLPSTSLKPL